MFKKKFSRGDRVVSKSDKKGNVVAVRGWFIWWLYGVNFDQHPFRTFDMWQWELKSGINSISPKAK